jgi:hypothetical protein
MPVVKVLTDGIGEFNLRDIDVYRERGGYEQWRRALTEMQPENARQRTTRAWRCRFSDGPQVVVSSEERSAALHGL